MSTREKAVEQNGWQQLVRPVGVSVLAGVLVCVAVLLAFSFVLSTQNIPQSLVGPMATLAISAGAFAGGLLCARIMRKKGLICGLVCGVVLSFVMLLASFGVDDSGIGVPALFKVIFILLSSMLGGVLGVNTKRRRGKR